jgi:hypothetical protein
VNHRLEYGDGFRADWEKIGKDIHGLFERPGELDSPEALDTVVGRLTKETVALKAARLRYSK